MAFDDLSWKELYITSQNSCVGGWGRTGTWTTTSAPMKETMHLVSVTASFVYHSNKKKIKICTNLLHRCGLLLWNLGLECLDLGARVGQQLEHFLLWHENDALTTHEANVQTSRHGTRESLHCFTNLAPVTNLHSHSKVVTIFNFRDLELHPHRHLPGKSEFIHL